MSGPAKPTTLAEIRDAIRDYVQTEGCFCCSNVEGHKAAKDRLGKLLRLPKYSDGSGYDFHAKAKKPLASRSRKHK